MRTPKRMTVGTIPRKAKPVSGGAPEPAVEPPQIRRILCPIDFSEFSLRAAENALELARLWSAEITVLFVFPALPADGAEETSPLPEAGIRSVVTKDMEEFLRPAGTAGLTLRYGFRVGDPAREILAAASALRPDLLVMGTHGRSGFERWVLGSVTDRVLRKARCPVLTVSLPANGPDQVPAKRVLCAIDLSETSERTLAYALALASKAKAPLTVVHVVEGITEATAPVPYGVSQYGLRLEAEARERLHRVLPSSAGCPVEEVVVTGKPYREILRLAAERGASLIVVGTHGPDPVDRMFFGSTADHVVRDAPCAVVTVRPPTNETR